VYSIVFNINNNIFLLYSQRNALNVRVTPVAVVYITVAFCAVCVHMNS